MKIRLSEELERARLTALQKVHEVFAKWRSTRGMQSSQSHEGTVVSEVNILADELQADRSKPDRSPEADAAFFRQKWQEEKSPERMLALETLSLTMGLSTASLGQREVPPTVNVSISDPPLPPSPTEKIP